MSTAMPETDRPRRGRPPLDPDERRTVEIRLPERVSPQQQRRLQRMAVARGFDSPGAWAMALMRDAAKKATRGCGPHKPGDECGRCGFGS